MHESDQTKNTTTRGVEPRTGGDRPRTARHRRGERAEGVISTAISVLIIAFLGIALWTGFNSMMNGATV